MKNNPTNKCNTPSSVSNMHGNIIPAKNTDKKMVINNIIIVLKCYNQVGLFRFH